MTAVKRRQVAVRPNTTPGHRAAEPRRTATLIGGGTAAALTAAASTFTGPGLAAARAIGHFLDFYGGVFCLVALSLTVMGGLLATDRLVLQVRHRILLQGVHRALAGAAMVFLALHIAAKVIEGHASIADVVVPFLAAHRPLDVGLGTLASYLMTGVAVTGVLRGRFAGSARPWLWRALHAGAYLAWPVALVHGLSAGRAAKSWVTASYLLCLVAVGLALVVRVCIGYSRRLRGPRTQTTATMYPVGRLRTSTGAATLISSTGGNPVVGTATGASPTLSGDTTGAGTTGVRTTIVLPPPGTPPPSRSAPAPHRPAPARAATPTPTRSAAPAPARSATPAPARSGLWAAERPAADRAGAGKGAPARAGAAPRPGAPISDEEFFAFLRGGDDVPGPVDR